MFGVYKDGSGCRAMVILHIYIYELYLCAFTVLAELFLRTLAVCHDCHEHLVFQIVSHSQT